MKNVFIIALLLVACSEMQSQTVLKYQEFETKYKATPGAILLDVRSVEEVAEGKIPTAKNIVYDDDFASKLKTLAHSPLFVYCGSGIRSAKAAKILREKGYDNVYELEGGIKAWRAAGKLVE